MFKNAQFEDGSWPTSQHTAPSGSIEDAARSPHRRTWLRSGFFKPARWPL